MASITTEFGEGGANLTPAAGSADPDLATVLRAFVDDLTEIRTNFVALLAKLDADAGVTDTDYASTLTPAALSNSKG